MTGADRRRSTGGARTDGGETGTTDDVARREPADRDTRGEPADAERTEEASRLFASAAVRIGLALVGFVLLLFALGQAVGFDLLGMVAEALSTRTGQWLLVAVFALLLILIAASGYGTRR